MYVYTRNRTSITNLHWGVHSQVLISEYECYCGLQTVQGQAETCSHIYYKELTCLTQPAVLPVFLNQVRTHSFSSVGA
jgi:hypothetical protein